MAALDVEIEDEVVATLIEAIVVDARGLVEKHLLACGLDRRHHLLVLGRQVVHVKLLLFNEEKGGSNPDGCVTLLLQLEHAHALVVPGREVIERGMRRHDPVPVCVLTRRVDRQPSLHVPETHSAIL